jgi:hypothetical protein
MRQVDQKVNFPENFSFLAFMTTELVSTQISSNNGDTEGGT